MRKSLCEISVVLKNSLNQEAAFGSAQKQGKIILLPSEDGHSKPKVPKNKNILSKIGPD